MDDFVITGDRLPIPDIKLKQLLVKTLEKGSNKVVAIDASIGHQYRQEDMFHACTALANELKTRNCSHVGICLPVSFEAIVAVAACILDEITYVLLDQNISREMLELTSSAADFSVVLAGNSSNDSGLTFIDVSDYCSTGLQEHARRLLAEIKENRITIIGEYDVCIVYTSGSSGIPKGVRIRESSLLNRLNWGWQRFPYEDGEVTAMRTPLAFGDSICEILSPLLKQIPILIIAKSMLLDSPRLMKCLYDYRVSRILAVPSILSMIVDFLPEDGTFISDHLKILSVSGEELKPHLAERVMDRLPANALLVNMYGSCEVMADVLYQAFSSIQDVRDHTVNGRLSIGSPIANTTAIIQHIDENEIGDLVVKGPPVSDGYIGVTNPDSRSKFLQHFTYDWCFQMGDRVSILKLDQDRAPCLVYHGRLDSLVKINGQRVDLTQVTNVLTEQYAVNPVVLFDDVKKRILAFVSHADFVRIVCEEKMRKLLPCYAVPEIVDYGNEPMPTKAISGKIDRKKLLDFYREMKQKCARERDNDDSWLKSQAEKEMGAVRAKSLRILLQAMDDAAGVSYNPTSMADLMRDNFFRIGGSSLNVLAVVLGLNQKEFLISVQEFLTAASIMDLVDMITRDKETGKHIEDTSDYDFHPATMEDADEISHLLATSFTRHGICLFPECGRKMYETGRMIMKAKLGIASQNPTSFVVRKRRQDDAGGTNDTPILGVYLSYELSDEAKIEMPIINDENELRLIPPRFMEYAEKPVVDAIKQQYQRILKAAVSVVDTQLIRSPNERVSLMYEMEKKLLQLAQQHRYEVIIASNTNPVTISAADELGYETVNVCKLREYWDHATKSFPFTAAKDTDVVKVQIKKLTH